MAIVFISHKLGEVLEIADRVTVLRRGKRVDTVTTEGATEQTLARLMVGRDVLLRVDKSDTKLGDPVLEVEDLHVLDDRDLEAVRGLSLTVRSGEIVALAGVDGNGQHELVEAIAGLRNAESGRVAIGGVDVAGQGVRATGDAGVAHIPEDRQLRGLVLDFTLAENLALRDYHKPPAVAPRLAEHRPHHRARPRPAEGVRRSRRRRRHAGRLALRAATNRRSASPARSPATRTC